MTTDAEIEATRTKEITDTVDQIRRLLIDFEIETKRRTLIQLDRWVNYEESMHAEQQ